MQTEAESKCRLCKHFDETDEYIIPACPIIAKEHCMKRHGRKCAQLHFNIFKEIEVELNNEHWHDHVPNQSKQFRR